MAAKRPTGELPKRLSKQAKLFKGDPNVNSAEAATYAGRNRDIAKKAASAKPAAKPAARSKSGASTVAAVAKRFGVTAREARDIATAVGSAATAIRKSPQEGMPVKKIVKNVAKQVKEVGTAATTGKKGTSAYQVKPNAASQRARGAAGDKGFVTYNVKGSKKR